MISSYFFMGRKKELESEDRGWGCLLFASCLLCAFHIHHRAYRVGGVQVRACLCRCGLLELTLLLSRIASTRVEPRWSFRARQSFVKFFPHDGGQMSAPVCRPSSYVHVTCQYVIEDEVLQTEFPFTTVSRLFLWVWIRGRIYTIDQIVLWGERTEVYLMSFIKNALKNCDTCLRNVGNHLDITEFGQFTQFLPNNQYRKWLVSLLVLDLDFAYVCHFTNTSLFPGSLFSFTVLFSSPLCIIPLLTSIKSLHPQTDQREGLSVSLLIPSLLDTINHRFHPNNNVLFSPRNTKWCVIALPTPLFPCKCDYFCTVMHDFWNNTCMIPNCVSVSTPNLHTDSVQHVEILPISVVFVAIDSSQPLPLKSVSFYLPRNVIHNSLLYYFTNGI